MPLGPVEFLIVRVPGNEFRGEIVPAIHDLVESGTVRIVDLIFIVKDDEGNVGSIELADLEVSLVAELEGLVDGFDGMMTIDDVDELGAMLEPNSSALAVLFENTWAAPFAQAARNANGEVIFNERIPREVIDELTAAIEEGGE